MATATYAYKVRDRAGKLLEGSIELTEALAQHG